ncbi:MAG: DedA family protein [Deltaproteobacteria bacterium]|nr:MAG: DedA family protein [Deltaproteobacteria bacterium]
MSLESACIPIPSEVIMPFGGFLAAQGRFSLLAVALAGTLGCLFGSIPAYFLGAYGGRPLIEKYGRYVLISRRDLDLADRWFERYGEATIFVCRLLPVVRTFIAFPAGVARMNFTRFSIYTLLGSFPWCLGLAWVGFKLGEHWTVVREYFHRFDLLILAVIVILAGLYVYRHVKNERSLREEGGE